MTTDINLRTGQTGTASVRKLKNNNSNSSRSVKKIAIVGLPNTGKSQIFNKYFSYPLLSRIPWQRKFVFRLFIAKYISGIT